MELEQLTRKRQANNSNCDWKGCLPFRHRSSRKVVVPTGETLQAYDDALDATTSLQESVGGADTKAFGLSIRQI